MEEALKVVVVVVAVVVMVVALRASKFVWVVPIVGSIVVVV